MTKKRIKIKYVDAYDGIEENFKFLEKFFDVEISDEPDYIIYSAFGLQHLKYDCVRIFYSGENLRADFNYCDYAITFDFLIFGDRHLRVPLYYFYESFQKALNKHIDIESQILERKSKFCNFIVSNSGGGGQNNSRNTFFQKLGEYKFVHSGGGYANNIGGRVEDKFKFQSECKFSLTFENSSTNGYLTEKLIDAAAAKTVPIYWGDPMVCEPMLKNGLIYGSGINPKAIINVADFDNFDDAIEHIMAIDKDDDKYLAMLREPLFLDFNHKEYFQNELEAFVKNIFDQPLQSAFRRGFGQWRMGYERRYKKAHSFRRARYDFSRKLRSFFKSLKMTKKP